MGKLGTSVLPTIAQANPNVWPLGALNRWCARSDRGEEELVAEATPCDHTDKWCARNKEREV